MRRQRVQVYLDESDMEYVSAVKSLCGFSSTSEATRFCIKLLRMILPKANLIARIVAEVLAVNERGTSTSPRPQA